MQYVIITVVIFKCLQVLIEKQIMIESKFDSLRTLQLFSSDKSDVLY